MEDEEEKSFYNPSQGNTRKFRCLIANDDPMQLYVIKMIFIQNNFHVTTA